MRYWRGTPHHFSNYQDVQHESNYKETSDKCHKKNIISKYIEKQVSCFLSHVETNGKKRCPESKDGQLGMVEWKGRKGREHAYRGNSGHEQCRLTVCMKISHTGLER